MGAGSSAPEPPDRGVTIESFDAGYVGSVPVLAPTGADVCHVAVERTLAFKHPVRSVELLVTSKGVYVIDPATGDEIKGVMVGDVSFVAQDVAHPKLVSFFENDRALRLIACHTFRLAKEAYRVSVAINDAFQAQQGSAVALDPARLRKQRRLGKKAAQQQAQTAGKRTAVDKGAKVYAYQARHLATVPVSRPRGDDVVAEALERMRAAGLPRDPARVLLTVYTKTLEVTDVAEGDALHTCSVRDVTFLRLDPATLELVYVLHDRRLNMMTCTLLKMAKPEQGEPNLRRLIDGAQRQLAQIDAVRRAAMKLVAAPGDATEHETGAVLGIFEAAFLGSLPVRDPKGDAVVRDALARALKLKATEGCFVQVSAEGVRVIASLTHEVLASHTIKDITFTSVAGRRGRVFAYVTSDDARGTLLCHLFQCAGERARDLNATIGDAFNSYAAEQEKTGGDPFQPYGDREDPPGALAQRQIRRNDLRAIKPIGAGQFGQVFLARQVVAPSGPSGGGGGGGGVGGDSVDRAVKMLRGGASELDRDEFVREAEVMLDLQHDNLVRLLGVAMTQRPWLMVLEFLQYGDLRGLLKGLISKDLRMRYSEQLTFATKIAAGMAYLAGKRLLHMDLAARNCLVARGNEVKVADFGLTRRLPDGADCWRSDKPLKLPVKWCSIEALDDRTFSEASDVWAFGVTVWEIFTYGEMPYPTVKAQEIQRRVREGLRLHSPPACPPDLFGLLTSCWRVARKDRPTFANIHRELAAYLRVCKDPVRDLGALLASTK